MSSSVGSKLKTGTVEGTGSALTVIIGFEPSWVRVLNIDGLATLEWTDSMADAEGLKEVTAGTKSFITSDGITPTTVTVAAPGPDMPGHNAGFIIGADADVNVAAETIHWVAGE